MTQPNPPRPTQPIAWGVSPFGLPSPDNGRRLLEEEQRAIELERIALEDAIRRAVARGTAEVRPPYQSPRTVLANRYLPAICTGLLLLLLHYLASP